MGACASSQPAHVSPVEKQNLLDKKLIQAIRNYPRWLQANKKSLNKINILLAEGANANTEGGTPLILAAQAGSKELVNALLKNKADANTQNDRAIIALVQSYIAERISRYKLFLQNIGAKKLLESLALNEKNPLIPRDLPGCIKDAKCSNYYPKADSNFDETEAALKILQKLQLAGANINTLDSEDAPIVLASRHCEWDLVNFFCRKGADLNIQDGVILLHAMHYGAKYNNWETAELLLDLGAFCRIKNMAILAVFQFNINSPLMNKIIQRWVELGVKPEEENRYSDPKSPDYSSIIVRKLQEARSAQQHDTKKTNADEEKISMVPFSVFNTNSRSKSPSHARTHTTVTTSEQQNQPQQTARKSP